MRPRHVQPLAAGPSLAALLLIPALLCGAAAEGTERLYTGSNDLYIECRGGAQSFEVAPGDASFWLGWDVHSCYCFLSAEEAIEWLRGLGEAAMTHENFPGIISTMTRKGWSEGIEPGQTVDMTIYCYSPEQANAYIDSLRPSAPTSPAP